MNKIPKSSIKRRKTEFNQDIATLIVSLFRSDKYSIAEVCRIANIGRTTYYAWMKSHPEFAEAVEEAERQRMENFTLVARNSLSKRIRFTTTTEQRINTKPGIDENGNPTTIIESIEEITRTVPADLNAIIYVLTTFEPNVWKKHPRPIAVAAKLSRSAHSRNWMISLPSSENADNPQK